MKRVVIYGAGRGGHMVAEILQSDPAVSIVGMVDDDANMWRKKVAGIDVLGGKDFLLDFWQQKSFDAVVISIATPMSMGLRKKLYLGLKDAGIAFTNAIHPSVVISPSAQVGENNVISPGVNIGTMTRIGNNNRISAQCNVEHHSSLGSHNFLGAHCVMGGAITIGNECVFGMGSIIESLLTIGDGAQVDSGMVVRYNLPDNTIVKS